MTILDFSKDYILENDFIRLSPLKMGHVQELLEISKDPDIWVFFLEKGEDLQQFTAYIKQAINNREVNKEYPFVVFDKTRKAYAGMTRFYEYSKDLNVIKLGHTWYGKDFRGTRVNKHCKYLLFDFAFETLGVERIGFGAHAENNISISAMKSIGCKEEGVLRNFIPSLDGKGRADILLFSILKGSWKESVKFELNNKLKKSKL